MGICKGREPSKRVTGILPPWSKALGAFRAGKTSEEIGERVMEEYGTYAKTGLPSFLLGTFDTSKVPKGSFRHIETLIKNEQWSGCLSLRLDTPPSGDRHISAMWTDDNCTPNTQSPKNKAIIDLTLPATDAGTSGATPDAKFTRPVDMTFQQQVASDVLGILLLA